MHTPDLACFEVIPFVEKYPHSPSLRPQRFAQKAENTSVDNQNPTVEPMPNHIDKILRENMVSLVPFLLRLAFGLEWSSAEPISDKQQVTLQRETDFTLHLNKGNKETERVVHIEFQVGTGKRLRLRMLLYYTILRLRYACPIEQIVLFLQPAPKRPPRWHWFRNDGVSYSYRVFYVHTLPFRALIDSKIPEEIVLAILSDYGDLPPEEAVETVLDRLKTLFGETFFLEKYVEQLRVLSSLRKEIPPILHQQLQKMPSIFFRNIKTDPWYLDGKTEGIAEGKAEGIAEGKAKGKAEGIAEGKAEGIAEGLEKSRKSIALLLKTGQFSPQEIARQIEMPLEFVQAVQDEMDKKV